MSRDESLVNVEELVKFEEEIARDFESGTINAPVHLCSPEQAEKLVEIFKDVRSEHWVFSTWRSHFHALLKGIPRAEVRRQIMDGHSMTIQSVEHRFMSSAIMGGCLPIACGVAFEGATAWVFVGDMCASTGAFADAVKFANAQNLDIRFVIEDNGLSTDTPTRKAWGPLVSGICQVLPYRYERTWPHYQSRQNEINSGF